MSSEQIRKENFPVDHDLVERAYALIAKMEEKIEKIEMIVNRSVE